MTDQQRFTQLRNAVLEMNREVPDYGPKPEPTADWTKGEAYERLEEWNKALQKVTTLALRLGK